MIKLIEMGRLHSAEIKPKHFAYSPTLDFKTLSNLLKIAKQTKNYELAKGCCICVLEDVLTDILESHKTQIPKESIKQYYKKYFDIIVEYKNYCNCAEYIELLELFEGK